MSLISNQIISSIAGLVFVLAIGAPLLRRYLGITPRENATGISPGGFDKNDVMMGGFLLIFYGISPLTAALSPASPPPDQANIPAPEIALTAGKILSGVLLQWLVLIAIIFRLRSRKIVGQTDWKSSFSLKNLGMIIGVPMVVYFFFFILQSTGLSDWISQMTGSSPSQESVKQLQDGTTAIKITLSITAVLFAPFLEEIAFRGYLYPVCKKLMGPILACIVTSLLFGIVHMNLVVFLPLSLFGVLLVIIYERTKSIWVPIGAHMVFNLATVSNILLS